VFFPKLSQVATTDVVSIEDHHTIHDAVHLMHAHKIRDVIVTGEAGLRILTAKELIEFRTHNVALTTPLSQVQLNHVPQLSPDASVIDGLAVIKNHPDEHLCLVDGGRRMIGIVSYTDLASCLDPQHLAQTKSIGQLVRLTRLVRAQSNHTIESVFFELDRLKQSAALVMEQGSPCGIITQSDIIRLVEEEVDWHQTIGEVMSAPLITFHEDMTLQEALTFSRARKIKRLVVVDEQRRVLGIVHQKDLVALVYQDWAQMLNQQKKQIESERDLFAGGPVTVIIWGAQAGWPIQFVSKNIETLLGYQAEELMQPDFSFVLLLHPQDVKRVGREVQSFIAQKKTAWEQHYRLRDKQGRCHWVYDYTRPEYDDEGQVVKLYGYLLDQTEQTHTRQALMAAQERFISVTNQAQHIIWETDADGLYTFVSPVVESILGYSPTQLVGHYHFYDLHPLEGREAFKQSALAVFQRHEAFHDVENQAQHRDGTLVWLSTNGLPIFDDTGRLSGYRGVDVNITERKYQAIALEQAQARVHLTMEATGTGLWTWYAQTNEVSWSDECYTQLGYVPQSFALDLAVFHQLVHPEDLPALFAEIERHFHDNRGFQTQFRLRSAQGEWRWTQGRGKVMQRDAQGEPLVIMGTHLDIHAQKQAELLLREREQQLAQQEALYRDLVEGHPYFINRYAADTTMLFVNQSMADYFGVPAQAMLGKPWVEGLPESEQARVRAHLASFTPQNTLQLHENQIYRYDGELRDVQWTNRAFFDEQGQLLYLQSVGVDITEQKRAQAALSEAKHLAETANQAKSAFLANMSHEIRTPMNAILGLSEMALRENLPPKARLHLSRIKQAADALLGILNDILDFSKIESGYMTLSREPFYFDTLMENLSALFSEAARKKGLNLLWQIDPTLDAAYIGDEMRLRQVLVNLIGNALKFTAQGEVSMRVHLTAKSNQQAWLRFVIEDSGLGISESQRARLFQPFSQADSSITREYGGTGLGLVISQRLVKAMGGGAIEVESELGRGSRFSFSVPLQCCSDQECARLLQLSDVAKPARLQGRVLLVEDNEINQEVALEALQYLGLEVVIAANGEQAVELARKQTFDLVLMDIQMPVMDGYQATQRIRAFNSQVPIIALTAAAMVEDKQKALAAGMNDHLGKPIDSERLYQVLSRWLPALPARVEGESSPTLAHLPALLAGFDIRQGVAQLGGNEDLYRRLLQRFAAQLSEVFATLPDDLQRVLGSPDNQQAWQQAQTLNHALKGVAGNLAATGLADLTTQLDNQLKQHQPPRAAQVQAMADLIRQALDSLATLPPLPKVSIADDKADIDQALHCLEALASRVKDNEFIDEGALRALAQSLPVSLRDSDWLAIRAALDEFDFPHAQALIAQLQQALMALR